MMKKTTSLICSMYLLITISALLTCRVNAQALAVRNDVPRVGQQEVLMLRHAFLQKGQYTKWYEISRDGVWPWFEKLGARIVGDWQVIYPTGASVNPELDEALRLVRYASYEHWQATRPTGAASSGDTGGSSRLAGNGPAFEKSNESLALRRTVQQGSNGGIFLQGYMAETRPVYMPGSGETFALTNDEVNEGAIAVRHGIALASDQILELRYWKVKKGSFEEFHVLTKTGSWPYLEKIGVRPVGQWRVVYLPTGTATESADYDEVYMLARYASYDHYLATRAPATLGGNGPDYEMLQRTLRQLDAMTQETSVQFLRGPMFTSPPLYMPALDENYTKFD